MSYGDQTGEVHLLLEVMMILLHLPSSLLLPSIHPSIYHLLLRMYKGM